MKSLKLTLLIAIPLMFTPYVHSADSSDSGDSGGSGYGAGAADAEDLIGTARSLIGKSKYKQALRELYSVVYTSPRNADAWNLIGYSNRKLGKYKQAGKAYSKALKYNPEHKGALEYQGELFISLKEYDKARANRDRLEVLCAAGCEELDDLNQSLSTIL